jgi:hypothetical protein
MLLVYGEDKKTGTKDFFSAVSDFMSGWEIANRECKLAEAKAKHSADQKMIKQLPKLDHKNDRGNN